MANWFVSRHPGAIAWAKQQSFEVDHWVEHLDLSQPQSGDKVIGSLPVNLAARLSSNNIEYWHLSLQIPEQLRGVELTAEQLNQLDAHLEAFHISSLPDAHL